MSVVYKPKHQRQIVSADKYGSVNCTAYSAAMAIDRATLGGVRVTGATVRAASNEPIPDPASPGLNLPQIVAVAFKWHVELVNRTGAPWSSLLAALREGRGLVLGGDYDQMGTWSCQASFRGDHAIYVNHISGDGDLYVMDPLCASAREVPPATIKAYAEKFARTIGTYPGLAFATTRITPLIV